MHVDDDEVILEPEGLFIFYSNQIGQLTSFSSGHSKAFKFFPLYLYAPSYRFCSTNRGLKYFPFLFLVLCINHFSVSFRWLGTFVILCM